MATETARVPDHETLRALLRSLRACLIITQERAEAIAHLELEDYRSQFDDHEAKRVGCEPGLLAQSAFDEEVSEAWDVLMWRAIVVADLVGEAVSSYAGNHSPLADPWMMWREEPPSGPEGEFVHGLTEEEFFCARIAYHVHSDSGIPRPDSVPTDGDIEDVPGYLETEPAGTWREWLEVLGPQQKAGHLSSVIDMAKRELTEGRARPGGGVEARLAEIKDEVAAFQMPVIELLERMGAKIDALGAPNRFKAEESLKAASGEAVYSKLSDDARTALLDAERRFRDPETLDWNSVVH